jgi:hypothetical protein
VSCGIESQKWEDLLFGNILSQAFAWKKWDPVRADINRQGLNCDFSYLNDGTGLIR